jgi:hypothetical protein
VSEELLAEGMVGHPPTHDCADILTSSFWGSYFHCPKPEKRTIAGRSMHFRKMSEEPRWGYTFVDIQQRPVLKSISN